MITESGLVEIAPLDGSVFIFWKYYSLLKKESRQQFKQKRLLNMMIGSFFTMFQRIKKIIMRMLRSWKDHDAGKEEKELHILKPGCLAKFTFSSRLSIFSPTLAFTVSLTFPALSFQIKMERRNKHILTQSTSAHRQRLSIENS